jgi:hypothetical protein
LASRYAAGAWNGVREDDTQSLRPLAPMATLSGTAPPD